MTTSAYGLTRLSIVLKPSKVTAEDSKSKTALLGAVFCMPGKYFMPWA